MTGGIVEVLAERKMNGAMVAAVIGDLTALEVDVVVNAANAHLQHGGGVAAALARAAGPIMQRASDAWVEERGPLGVGDAAVTPAGDLPAHWVVHVAGPVYGQGVPDDETHLRAAVRGALRAADDLDVTSVALPAISAGIYGYPVDEATRLIVDEVLRILPDTVIGQVLLVGLDDAVAGAFAEALA